MFKLLGALLTIAIAVGLLIVGWPQLFGLQNTWVIAQAASMRGLAVAGALVFAVIFLVIALAAKPARAFAGSIVGLLLVFSLANGAVAMSRGVGDTSFASWTDDSITVFSWNTLGDAPGPEEIARLALEAKADIITLPETTKETGIAVATAMREGGNRMWVETVAFDQISKARSTTILISPRLGSYERISTNENRADNTKVLPSVVLKPVSGDGPTIVAVHAVAPIRGQMTNWADDLAWLAARCQDDNVIMAGDFNATVDHMAGLGHEGATLGKCHDAGTSSGNGSVGTWNTAWPALLGTPIDHVMATKNWTTTGMRVIQSADGAGSDHRPIVVQLTPAKTAAQ